MINNSRIKKWATAKVVVVGNEYHTLRREISLTTRRGVIIDFAVQIMALINDEWKNPRCSETNLIFTTQTDTFFGVHLRLNLDSYNNSYPTQLIFNNPMINGVYLKLFKKSNEGFYQLSMFPATSISIVSKKVLFMIDYDSRKSTTNRKQVLDELKQYIKGSFSTSDYFNLFYSSLSIGKVANDWIKADSANIETAFN